MKNFYFIFFTSFFSFCSAQSGQLHRYYVYYRNSNDAAQFKKNYNERLSYYSGEKKEIADFFKHYKISSFDPAFPSYPVEELLRVYLLETEDAELMINFKNQFPALVEKYEEISGVPQLQYYPNDYGITNPNGSQGINIDRRDLDYINAPKAWDISTGRGVTIGISDARIKPDDPDFVDKITFLPEYTYGSLLYSSSNSYSMHGTSVAALAAARGNNNYGSTGVCMDCNIIAVDFGNYDHLKKLADAGAKVINMSWMAGSVPSVAEQNAINYLANEMGVVLVAAAGNINSFQTYEDHACDTNFVGIQKFYPASYDNVISVSNVEHYYPSAYYNGAYCCTSPLFDVGMFIQNSFSPNLNINNRDNPIAVAYNGYPQPCSPNGLVYTYTANEFVDILAPANRIYNHVKLAEEGIIAYHEYGGTSSATPLVSGTAALMISAYNCITPKEVENILKLTSKDVVNMTINQFFKDYIGAGKLETGDAVEFVNEMKKNNGEAVIKNHSFNRFTFDLQRINNNLSIENVTFKDDCVVNFVAKNSISILPGSHLKPNTNGNIHLKVNKKIINTCRVITPNTSKKENKLADNSVDDNSIAIMPNPIKSGTVLKIRSKNIIEKNIQIFDLSGKQIYNSNGIEQINIPFPAGIYIIKITENGKTTSKKLIVK